MTKTDLNHDQKQSLIPYAFGVAGILLMFVPHTVVPLTGLVCLLMGLVLAYVMRFKSNGNPFVVDHMTYFIRTVWGGFGLLCLGLFFFVSIVYANADFTVLEEFKNEANSGVIATRDEVFMQQALFVQSNGILIIVTAAICLFPMPAFMMVRMLKGVRRMTRIT